jgi:cytochrome oxidase Cu insertion factor (SCO1/SenC/PrrC family)
MRSRWTTTIVAAACAGIGFGTVLGFARPWSPARSPVTTAPSSDQSVPRWGPGSRRAPGFALETSAGRLVSLRSQRGRIVLLTFLDSRCTRACPLEGRLLTDVQRRLRGTNVRPSLLVVTVDPWGDTSQSSRAFMRKAGWVLPWHWLGGSPRELRPVWRTYGVGVRRVPGDILHTVVLYLIDPRGYERAAYLFPFPPRLVARDVRRIATAS